MVGDLRLRDVLSAGNSSDNKQLAITYGSSIMPSSLVPRKGAVAVSWRIVADDRMALRRALLPAALAAFTVGLGWLVPEQQAALAVSQGAATISAGAAQTCALESGQAYCWGDNAEGALGDGGAGDSSIPVAVDAGGVLGGKSLTQIAVGAVDACALDGAGAAYCWGYNAFGQLGDGSTVHSAVPVAVDTSGVLAGKTLTHITAGDNHMCALDSVGAAYCWGDNADGELGDGTTADSSVPVAVDASGVLAGKTLTQITAESDHTCAVDSTGAAYCWGDNSKANSATAPRPTPASRWPWIPAASWPARPLTQITAGTENSCALDSAGAAYCWGNNAFGQLGDGYTGGSSVPVAVDTSGVLAGKTLTQITAGLGSACALDSAGVAYCWGYNYYGELGDPSIAFSTFLPVPVDTSGVLAGKTLTQITAGWEHTCALDTAGAATAGATTPKATSVTTTPPKPRCQCLPGRMRPPASPPFRATPPPPCPGQLRPAWTAAP